MAKRTKFGLAPLAIALLLGCGRPRNPQDYVRITYLVHGPCDRRESIGWPDVCTAYSGRQVAAAGPDNPLGHRIRGPELFGERLLGDSFDGSKRFYIGLRHFGPHFLVVEDFTSMLRKEFPLHCRTGDDDACQAMDTLPEELRTPGAASGSRVVVASRNRVYLLDIDHEDLASVFDVSIDAPGRWISSAKLSGNGKKLALLLTKRTSAVPGPPFEEKCSEPYIRYPQVSVDNELVLFDLATRNAKAVGYPSWPEHLTSRPYLHISFDGNKLVTLNRPTRWRSIKESGQPVPPPWESEDRPIVECASEDINPNHLLDLLGFEKFTEWWKYYPSSIKWKLMVPVDASLDLYNVATKEHKRLPLSILSSLAKDGTLIEKL